MAGILVDTSVWVAHFRRRNTALSALLEEDRVLCHPLIVIEIGCGTPPAPRERTLALLRGLRQPVIATSDEVLEFIEGESVPDSRCGAVDASLLAATLLTASTRLWTADRALASIAKRLGIAFEA